jgi:hypothetical protein
MSETTLKIATVTLILLTFSYFVEKEVKQQQNQTEIIQFQTQTNFEELLHKIKFKKMR